MPRGQHTNAITKANAPQPSNRDVALRHLQEAVQATERSKGTASQLLQTTQALVASKQESESTIPGQSPSSTSSLQSGDKKSFRNQILSDYQGVRDQLLAASTAEWEAQPFLFDANGDVDDDIARGLQYLDGHYGGVLNALREVKANLEELGWLPTGPVSLPQARGSLAGGHDHLRGRRYQVIEE